MITNLEGEGDQKSGKAQEKEILGIATSWPHNINKFTTTTTKEER